MTCSDNDLNEINRQFNALQFVPNEEAAMTSILWRDPAELKPEHAPVLLKMTLTRGASFYYVAASCQYEVRRYLQTRTVRESITAWAHLPKLEG